MIRQSRATDFEDIWTIINEAAEAYRGIIPADRWHEPYMAREKLRHEIESGVDFWIFEDKHVPLGVMGVQRVEDVTLVRHAYVRTCQRRSGVGGQLLAHMREQTDTPILIGAWSTAVWAIRFYEKHGFAMVPLEMKDWLLRRYWDVPARQIETSVVLADARWRAAHDAGQQ